MNGFACLLTLLAVIPSQAQQGKDIVLESPFPIYKVTLPKGYEPVVPREDPLRYVRSAAREEWAKVSAQVRIAENPVAQNADGPTEALIRPFITLPPDSKATFTTARWMDLNIGVIEYRAVVKELPVVGRVALLPLRGRAVTLHVFAPEPLEKEMSNDFVAILVGFSGRPSWRTAEQLETIRTYDRLGMAGAGLLLLYFPALLTVFRGHPMKLHWLRIVWLTLSALLLFLPVFSPGDTTFLNNLVVNSMLPLVLLLFAGRRIKLGIEML